MKHQQKDLALVLHRSVEVAAISRHGIAENRCLLCPQLRTFEPSFSDRGSGAKIFLKIFGADKAPRTLRRTFSPELLPDKPLQREPRRKNAIISGLIGFAGFESYSLVWPTPSRYIWATRKVLGRLKYRYLQTARRGTEARSSATYLLPSNFGKSDQIL